MRLAKLSLIASLLVVILPRAFVEAGDVRPQQADLLKGAAKIVGKVRIEGAFQRPVPLQVFKNRDFCGATVPNESLLVGSEGGVQNAVVVIAKSPEDQSAIPSTLVLDNKNCAFVPRVQVVPAGSDVLLLNSDPILHNVHARLGRETLFNVGLPAWRRVTKRFTREGIVKIDCDVLHTWMGAYIVVTPAPYFAVTDEKGEFVIEGVPAGIYEMEVWHEKLGTQTKQLSVTENTPIHLEVIYSLK